MTKSISSLSSLLNGRGINFINGARVAGTGTSENLYNPANGKVFNLFFQLKM